MGIDTGSTVTAMIGTEVISITLDDRVYPEPEEEAQ